MGVRGPVADIQPFVELAQRPDTSVYKAYQRSLERFVLLKVMRLDEHVSEGRAQRFGQEARLVARIQHPNVVCVYDYGETEGETYIVSEFVEGCDLAMLLEGGRLPVDVGVYVLRMITQGLAAAHSSGVLHRDIKPANILISAAGDVKLADFGMASLRSEVEDVRGTLAYLSPEQLRGSAADERSDLFSLGATLFEMLAGRQAFQASGRSATIDAILHFDPLPLLEADHRVPEKLREMCAALLDKDPARRPHSAAAVLERVADVERAIRPATPAQVAAFLQDPDSYRPAPAPSDPFEPASVSKPLRARRRNVQLTAAILAVSVATWATIWFFFSGSARVAAPRESFAGEADDKMQSDVSEAVELPDSEPLGPDPPVNLPDYSRVGGQVLNRELREAEADAPTEASRSIIGQGEGAALPPESEVTELQRPTPFVPSSPQTPGGLYVTSDPWVAVFVDGDSMGTSPLGGLTLLPGAHEIVLRNPFFPPYRRLVQIASGELDTLAVSLWATVAQVTVQARPWATVFIDGEEAGTVPLRDRPFYLVPGRRVLRLENPVLGASREVILDLKAGESRTLEMDLMQGNAK